MRKLLLPLLLAVAAFSATLAHAVIYNYKSGIDVIWGGTEGVDWKEEYLYHDPLLDDHKVVYIKANTTITMGHNDRNIRLSIVPTPQHYLKIGASGGGIIRYKIDRDWQDRYTWADNTSRTQTARVLPAYSAPFTLASQTYAPDSPGTSVVGAYGPVPGGLTPQSNRNDFYYRGIRDTFTDEWHVLSYCDDDNVAGRAEGQDSAYFNNDGKTVLLVVNPVTPCFSPSITGTAQWYTTPPKAYYTPKINSDTQVTYFELGSGGTATFEICDINGNNVSYKINGGVTFNAGSNSTLITDSQFANGPNTLEYWFTGGVHKTRTVVKNPAFPSASEPHGNITWGDATGFNIVRNRITNAPFATTYNTIKTRGDQSKQDTWDANSRYATDPLNRGYRWMGDTRTLTQNSGALINAFVAVVEYANTGILYQRPGARVPTFRYAIEMCLDNIRTIDELGYELLPTGTHPSYENTYRGYFDVRPLRDIAFAYDIIVANFRSNQVTNGLTAIEDYFIRDKLAQVPYDAALWNGGFVAGGFPVSANNKNGLEPKMWGGARDLIGAVIGILMPNYSTPYYGTSGFGVPQATYPFCPFESDQYTWKDITTSATIPIKSYPDYCWDNGWNGRNGVGKDLTAPGNSTFGNYMSPNIKWADRPDYFGNGNMGTIINTFLNITKMWYPSYSNTNMETLVNLSAQFKFTGCVASGAQPIVQDGVANGTTTFTSALGTFTTSSNILVPPATPGAINGYLIFSGGSNSLSPTIRQVVAVNSQTSVTLDSPLPAGTGISYTWGQRESLPLLLNNRFPTVAQYNTAWIQGLPSTDGDSDDRLLSDINVVMYPWYDPNYYGNGSIPTAPTGLAATALSSSTVTLTWNDNSGDEIGFKIERSLDGLSNWVQIAQTPANIQTYPDSGLSPQTQYFYRVKAFNDSGDSAYATANTTTLAPPPPVLIDAIGQSIGPSQIVNQL